MAACRSRADCVAVDDGDEYREANDGGGEERRSAHDGSTVKGRKENSRGRVVR
jgi:hypothetical protein